MHVEEGNMTCRGCGHVYRIANGIPNMVSSSYTRGPHVYDTADPAQLLAEHEVSR